MPFRDRLASRMTAGSLAAISPATASAAARSSGRGTTSSTVPKPCSCWAVTVRQVYTMVRISCCGTSRDR